MDQPDSRQNCGILVVEDEFIIATDLAQRLELLGYQVCGMARSGEAALELAAQNQPDLVLMDIILAGEMDGIETAERLRRETDVPVVFLTAFADEERLSRAKLTLPFGYLLKPFQDRELRVTLEMALHTARNEARRRTAEQELRRFKRMVNASLNAVSLVGTDYVYQVVNDTYLERTGLKPEHIQGRHVAEIFGQELFDEKLKPRLDQALAGKNAELQGWFDLPHHGWRFLDASYSPYRERTGGDITGVLVSSRDITDLARSQQESRRNLRILEQVVETMEDAVFVKDMEGRHLMLNQACAEIMGVTREESLGRTFDEFFEPAVAQAMRVEDETVKRTKRPLVVEQSLMVKGRKRWFRTTKQPLLDGEGDMVGILGIAREIAAPSD